MVVGEDAPGSLDLAHGPARGAWAPAAQAGRSLKGAERREKPRGQAVRLEGWEVSVTGEVFQTPVSLCSWLTLTQF